jgi:hypothetical protein
LAIVAAPFIALLYDAAAGLGVMAAALAATTFLLAEAVSAAPVHARRRVRLVVALNLALAAACVAAAVWIVAGR